MTEQYRQLIKNQQKTKVAVYTGHNHTINVWFLTLAAAVAGVFYFFGEKLWVVLAGG